MSIQRIDSNNRMSQAVIVNGMVYLAGQVGTGSTVSEQTRTALESVEALLHRSGSDKSHLVNALMLLTNMADFDEMNSVWDAWVADVGPPARASAEVRLAAPEYRVEIIVVAAVAAS